MGGTLKGVQKFMVNYMNQVQVLLMFIAGTRGADWKLHLTKLEELLPYFHAQLRPVKLCTIGDTVPGRHA